VHALVDEREAAADRNVMQVIAFVVNDQRDARVAAHVGHPASVSMSVEPNVVFAERVVNDSLARCPVRTERGYTAQRGASKNRLTGRRRPPAPFTILKRLIDDRECALKRVLLAWHHTQSLSTAEIKGSKAEPVTGPHIPPLES
jgi:hypothetical protein